MLFFGGPSRTLARPRRREEDVKAAEVRLGRMAGEGLTRVDMVITPLLRVVDDERPDAGRRIVLVMTGSDRHVLQLRMVAVVVMVITAVGATIVNANVVLYWAGYYYYGMKFCSVNGLPSSTTKNIKK